MSLNKCECQLSTVHHFEEGTGCVSCSTCSSGWKVCLADDDRIDITAQFLPIFKKKDYSKHKYSK